MTTDLELDRVLAAWLADGAERASDDDVATALRQVARIRQRRRVPTLGRPLSWLADERSWAAVAIVLVAVVAMSSVVGSGSVLPARRSIDPSLFAAAITDPAADQVAFVAHLPADAPETLRWRAATFDSLGPGGGMQSDIATVKVPSGEPLLAAGEETPATDVTSPLTVTIQTSGTSGSVLLSPGVPLAVDADATVRLIGDHGWFAGADLPSGTTTYTVHARVLPLDGEAGTSANQLRGAGQDYPSSVIDRYTAVPAGVMGPSSQQLLRAILATTPERDPYDLATAIEAYLRSDKFTYSVDPPAATCSSSSIVECFARSRTGYCLHYATTMAVLLRAALPDDPIPTRLVEGFLPGDRVGTVETVRNRSAHAWLEVYFPGYGWVPFDPTPPGSIRSVTAP